jgi:hypothetical protein
VRIATLDQLYGIFRAVRTHFENEGLPTTAEGFDAALRTIDDLHQPDGRAPEVITAQQFNRVLVIIRGKAVENGYGGIANAIDHGLEELRREIAEEQRIPPSNGSAALANACEELAGVKAGKHYAEQAYEQVAEKLEAVLKQRDRYRDEILQAHQEIVALRRERDDARSRCDHAMQERDLLRAAMANVRKALEA